MADSSLFPSHAKNKNTQARREEGGGREEAIEVKKVIPVELPLKLDQNKTKQNKLLVTTEKLCDLVGKFLDQQSRETCGPVLTLL